MDYGVDEPTSSLDDSRSTSMVGAREGLARRMETDANIRDLNARIPDVQPARVAFNNQPISGDFFVNRVSRGLQNLFGGGDGGDRDTTRSSPSANRTLAIGDKLEAITNGASTNTIIATIMYTIAPA